MNQEQQSIYDYLLNNALGYKNRKSSSQIRDDLGLEGGGLTNEHIRDLIRDMIINHGRCIGSLMWKTGYWIIQTKEELDLVCSSLTSRANSIKDRADALRNGWINNNKDNER